MGPRHAPVSPSLGVTLGNTEVQETPPPHLTAGGREPRDATGSAGWAPSGLRGSQTTAVSIVSFSSDGPRPCSCGQLSPPFPARLLIHGPERLAGSCRWVLVAQRATEISWSCSRWCANPIQRLSSVRRRRLSGPVCPPWLSSVRPGLPPARLEWVLLRRRRSPWPARGWVAHGGQGLGAALGGRQHTLL